MIQTNKLDYSPSYFPYLRIIASAVLAMDMDEIQILIVICKVTEAGKVAVGNSVCREKVHFI
jgi:predicted deacetylase